MADHGSIDVRDDGCVVVVFPGASKGMLLPQERSFELAMMILSKLMRAMEDQGGPPTPKEVSALLRVQGFEQGGDYIARFVREDGAYLDCRVSKEIDQALHLAMQQYGARSPN